MKYTIGIGDAYLKSLSLQQTVSDDTTATINTTKEVLQALTFGDVAQASAILSAIAVIKSYDGEVMAIKPLF